ncbi:MAG TPA: TolC family protein [Thermoanaerobaculia bacterium]|jgi:outer membrane protein TolC
MTEDRSILTRRPRATALAAALALLVVPMAPVDAASRTVSATPATEVEEPALRFANGELTLSLDEAIELALQRNLGLVIQRYSRQQVRLGVQQAMGIYDLNFGGTASAAHDESPLASNLEGVAVQESDSWRATLGVTQLLPTGGTAQFGGLASKFDTNALSFGLNPSFGSGAELSLTQPLLRNFGKSSTEFGIRVARLSSEQSSFVFQEEVIRLLQIVEGAYWRLVEAREQLKVAEESKRLAMQLHENNRVRVDVGTLAPLELVSSEAGIATREEELIRARAEIGNAEDVLKTLLRLEGDKVWAATIVPETAPDIEHAAVDLDQALVTGLESRLELRREEVAQRSREVEAAYYRYQRKPRLDLSATYGFSGTGGDLVIRDDAGNVVATVPGGLSDAVDQVTGGDFPGWSVGLELGIPIQNRDARARATIAELAVDQGRTGIDQVRQLVTTEVRLAVRGVETASQELESARVSVRLQTANLDAERKKFTNGLSTSFQILQVEEDLTNARSREVRAVTGYRRALVEYNRAIGKLIERSGVEIVD